MYHYTDGGLRNVWLSNGYEIKKTPYGEAVSIQDVDGLVAAICQAITRKGSRLSGAEFRYLRQVLLLSQASLGRTLGRTEQAVALWEKNSRIPKYADTLLRVIYAQHANGNEKIKNIVHAANDAERAIHFIMKETGGKWKSEISSRSAQECEEAEFA